MSIQVASVPASHVYIRHLGHPPEPELEAAPGAAHVPPAPVLRLPDPPSAREDPPTGAPWWPLVAPGDARRRLDREP